MPSGLPDRICPLPSPHLTAGHAGLGFNNLGLLRDWVRDSLGMVLLLTRVNGVGIARHRLNRLFVNYFPGELPDAQNEKRRDEITSYYEKTGECFAVGSVARAFEPGCKVDCLPVLVGRQAWKKSGAIQALVTVPAWFSDELVADLSPMADAAPRCPARDRRQHRPGDPRKYPPCPRAGSARADLRVDRQPGRRPLRGDALLPGTARASGASARPRRPAL
jgi:virulence-associated protein E